MRVGDYVVVFSKGDGSPLPFNCQYFARSLVTNDLYIASEFNLAYGFQTVESADTAANAYMTINRKKDLRYDVRQVSLV